MGKLLSASFYINYNRLYAGVKNYSSYIIKFFYETLSLNSSIISSILSSRSSNSSYKLGNFILYFFSIYFSSIYSPASLFWSNLENISYDLYDAIFFTSSFRAFYYIIVLILFITSPRLFLLYCFYYKKLSIFSNSINSLAVL